MSLWTDIGAFVANLATDTFSTVVESIRTMFGGDAQTRKRVAFSIAIIALSAKMAKADGIVTEDEVQAFQQIFAVPSSEVKHVARVYNLAKQDVAGYTSYGRQVRSLFPGDDPTDEEILTDVMDALFHIAKADDVIHENELLFLEDLAVLFGFNEHQFATIKARHAGEDESDAYRVLDAERGWDFPTLKAQYRKKVAENHPDRLMARGVPPEFVVLANDRLASINAAWERIEAARRNEALPVR